MTQGFVNWLHHSHCLHKKRRVVGEVLSMPRPDGTILVFFTDRRKSTWVKVDSLEPHSLSS